MVRRRPAGGRNGALRLKLGRRRSNALQTFAGIRVIRGQKYLWSPGSRFRFPPPCASLRHCGRFFRDGAFAPEAWGISAICPYRFLFAGIRVIRGSKNISAIRDPISGFRLPPRLCATAGDFSMTARSRLNLGR